MSWVPYILILCIIFGIAQYLLHNNLSLLLGCQLLIFSMGHTTGGGTFFHSLRFLNRSFLKSPGCCLKTLQITEIYKIDICK